MKKTPGDIEVGAPPKKGVKYVKVSNRTPGVFSVNFEHASHLFIVSLLLSLNN